MFMNFLKGFVAYCTTFAAGAPIGVALLVAFLTIAADRALMAAIKSRS